MLKIKFLSLPLACLFLLQFATITWSQDDLQLTDLVDQVVDVRLTKNQQYSGFTVISVTEGSQAGSIEKMRVRYPDSKKTRSVSVAKIVEIFLDGQPLDVVYDKKGRFVARSEEKRAERIEWEREVNSSLARTRARLWQPLTAAEHEKWMETHNAFLEKTKSALPNIEFRYVETEYFMFLTNLAPQEVDGLLELLDAMYSEMCKAFDVPPTHNIWCGKCVVVAFREQAEYLAFEQIMMKQDATGTQGLCHTRSDGRVIFSGYQGRSGFPSVLVHETSHGFVHRYMSNAKIPNWLNEGMADWIAKEIAKEDRVPRKRKLGAAQVRKAGTLGNFFTKPRMQGAADYGIASSMVELLVSVDDGDGKFKEFFDAIKMGDDPEQALKEKFNLTYQELTIMYAQAIGLQKIR